MPAALLLPCSQFSEQEKRKKIDQWLKRKQTHSWALIAAVAREIQRLAGRAHRECVLGIGVRIPAKKHSCAAKQSRKPKGPRIDTQRRKPERC